jgi:hypothetical protein
MNEGANIKILCIILYGDSFATLAEIRHQQVIFMIVIITSLGSNKKKAYRTNHATNRINNDKSTDQKLQLKIQAVNEISAYYDFSCHIRMNFTVKWMFSLSDFDCWNTIFLTGIQNI